MKHQSTKAKQTTRRCHWVPQAYLKAFAADAEERLRIWRFSKHAGDPEHKKIEKVAVRFHLYVPRDKTGWRDDSFERKLAGLEQWFDDSVWRTLRDDMVDLDWEPLRKMVSLLTAVMFLRNPLHFEMIKRFHGQFVNLCSGPHGLPSTFEIGGKVYPVDLDSWPSYKDASEDDLKRLWINEINRATSYAEKLMKMRWSIIFSDEPLFITSDNPVTFIHPSLRFRGINYPDTAILLPLSPTRVLRMDNLHSEPANQYYPLQGSPAPQNLLMWRNSIDYMFSHRHPDSVCIELLGDAERQEFA
ncbi:MAG: DUF4238 domain-containing protein [Paracoccaceae bacterium]|nr:DUF4238 domain-containing protein [Paracoccaceae bacterium]